MQQRFSHARRRVPRWALAALALAAVAAWVPGAMAAFRSTGAGGCPNFKATVDVAQNGDVLTPMYDGGEGRNSEGAVITKNIVVEGGWSPPGAGCPNNSDVSFTSAAEMLEGGFTYGGPTDRAALKYFSGPAVTFSSAVTSTLFYATNFYIQDSQVTTGGAGVYGTGLTGAKLRFDQVGFIPDPNGSPSPGNAGNGGGMLLDVGGGSQVTLSDVDFKNLNADNGGGFDITLRGGSSLVMNRVTVSGNEAIGGHGGGGRIVLYSGYVTITDSLFSNNIAGQGGGALRIERPAAATGPAVVTIVNTRFTGNSAPVNSDIETSGSGLTVRNLSRPAYLPLALSPSAPGVQINKITRTLNTYVVDFTPVGFTPSLSGLHVHFFFDTVAPTQAGMPGTGPWVLYGGGSPFTLYGVSGRPGGATRMCALVANADHSVRQGTGNCLKLP